MPARHHLMAVIEPVAKRRGLPDWSCVIRELMTSLDHFPVWFDIRREVFRALRCSGVVVERFRCGGCRFH